MFSCLFSYRQQQYCHCNTALKQPNTVSELSVKHMSDHYLNLVFSSAKLLSGRRFEDCQDDNDETCSGGVAAVAAYSRYTSGGHPTLVLPQLDFQSPFIQQHPLALDANRLVMNHLLGWKLFLMRSWFLGVEESQQKNVAGLQSTDWPLVISNVAVPSTNSWYHYTRGIFFDDETGLAIIHITEEIDVTSYHYPKTKSSKIMLDRVKRVNQLSGCIENTNVYDIFINQTIPAERKCWIPVVIADLVTYDPQQSLLQELAEYENAPALFLDFGGKDATLNEIPKQIGPRGLWALSFQSNSEKFQQVKLRLDGTRNWIIGATFEVENITSQLPSEVRDGTYTSHIAALRQYSEEAMANDPEVGSSNTFPIAKQDDCDVDTYWVEEYAACFRCPTLSGVLLTPKQNLDFLGRSGERTMKYGEASIQNKEEFSVDLVVKTIPPFLSCDETIANFCTRDRVITIEPGGRFSVAFAVTPENLEAGTAHGEVVIGVSNGDTYPGCRGNDLSFKVEMTVLDSAELNQLGRIRIIGWVFASIVMATALVFATWCLYRREHRVVKVLQPIFLVTVCFGVFVMGSALIPLSIDHEMVLWKGVSMACMADAWLLCMGFSIAVGALISKLWRINKVFASAAAFRRTTVRHRDVLFPLCILCSLNVVLLLTWTLVDPRRWRRVEIEGEPWNAYGVCRSESDVTEAVFFTLLGLVNFGALLLACWQAYKAMKISDEFSEASSIGIVIFSWLQLTLVGVPVTFLIDKDNIQAKYVNQTSILFLACMSLLLWIFLPIIKVYREKRSGQRPSERVVISGIPTQHMGTNLSAAYSGVQDNTVGPERSKLLSGVM